MVYLGPLTQSRTIVEREVGHTGFPQTDFQFRHPLTENLTKHWTYHRQAQSTALQNGDRVDSPERKGVSEAAAYFPERESQAKVVPVEMVQECRTGIPDTPHGD